jgi:hypothetical protein
VSTEIWDALNIQHWGRHDPKLLVNSQRMWYRFIFRLQCPWNGIFP